MRMTPHERYLRNLPRVAAWRAANSERVKEHSRKATLRWQDANPRETRDTTRRRDAERGGYLPPPPERDCPPRTDHCQYCHKPMDPDKVHMDHNHNTGAFLAWCCDRCNKRINDRIDDFGERPRRRTVL
jgi:Recombination endonuclease VII